MDEPKRPKSKGAIPVIARLKLLLDQHWERCGRSRKGFIFANELGNPMNLEALAMDVIRPALQQANLAWHGWHAFRRGLATNLHRLGVSDKVIQQILRHANVSTTMNIYVKTVSADAALNFRTPKQYTRLRLLRIACLSFIEMLSTVSTYDRYEREQLRSYRTHSPQALYLFYW